VTQWVSRSSWVRGQSNGWVTWSVPVNDPLDDVASEELCRYNPYRGVATGGGNIGI